MKRRENLLKEKIRSRESYMFCIGREGKKQVDHLSVPIMIGSMMDFYIRGFDVVMADRYRWGCVLIKGVYKIYTAFSTFNALSLHVRQTAQNKRHVEWYFYVGRKDGCALRYYDNGSISWTYQKEIHSSSDAVRDLNWLTLLDSANRFLRHSSNVDSTSVRRAMQYVQLFVALRQYKDNINSLTNRQILSGVTMKRKFLDRELTDVEELANEEPPSKKKKKI